MYKLNLPYSKDNPQESTKRMCLEEMERICMITCSKPKVVDTDGNKMTIAILRCLVRTGIMLRISVSKNTSDKYLWVDDKDPNEEMVEVASRMYSPTSKTYKALTKITNKKYFRVKREEFDKTVKAVERLSSQSKSVLNLDRLSNKYGHREQFIKGLHNMGIIKCKDVENLGSGSVECHIEWTGGVVNNEKLQIIAGKYLANFAVPKRLGLWKHIKEHDFLNRVEKSDVSKKSGSEESVTKNRTRNHNNGHGMQIVTGPKAIEKFMLILREEMFQKGHRDISKGKIKESVDKFLQYAISGSDKWMFKNIFTKLVECGILSRKRMSTSNSGFKLRWLLDGSESGSPDEISFVAKVLSNEEKCVEQGIYRKLLCNILITLHRYKQWPVDKLSTFGIESHMKENLKSRIHNHTNGAIAPELISKGVEVACPIILKSGVTFNDFEGMALEFLQNMRSEQTQVVANSERKTEWCREEVSESGTKVISDAIRDNKDAIQHKFDQIKEKENQIRDIKKDISKLHTEIRRMKKQNEAMETTLSVINQKNSISKT